MRTQTIVSLVPSLTELVFWFGLGECVVGRTRFCIEPAGEVERVAIVGGTKNPRVDRIVALRPALVLANKEENRREDIEALRAAGLEVVLTDPNTVADAATMIRDLGVLLGARGRSEDLAAHIAMALAEVPSGGTRPRVAVAVWQEPFMALGAESYGHDLIQVSGGQNVFAGQNRYPEVSLAELAALGPELILLPDEPYPFKESDCAAFARIAPTQIVDGKLVWWYGPRMPEAIRTLNQIFASGERRQ